MVKAAVQSALTFKLLEFLSSLVSYVSLAKGFGPFWWGALEKRVLLHAPGVYKPLILKEANKWV